MKSFLISGDANGAPSYAIEISDSIQARVLAANVAETVTVPSGANLVVFSANADFYIRSTGTAAVPGADVTDGSGSELNPKARSVKNLSTFSIVAPATAIVTMAFYA